MDNSKNFSEEQCEIIDAHAHYIAPLLYNKNFFTKHEERFQKVKKEGKPVDHRLKQWFHRTMSSSSHKDSGLHCLLEDMEMAGVNTTVLASISPDEDKEIQRVTTSYPNLYGLFWLDHDNPSISVDRFLHARSMNPKLLGMKANMQYYQIRPNHPPLFQAYEILNSHHLPIQFHVGIDDEFADFDNYSQIADTFPNMKMILLHAGGQQWRKIPDLLLKHPNIFVELEALQLKEMEREEPQVLLYLLKHCPKERLLFGSDWIWSDATYFKRVAVIKNLSPEIRSAISKDNAQRVLSIDISSLSCLV